MHNVLINGEKLEHQHFLEKAHLYNFMSIEDTPTYEYSSEKTNLIASIY